MFKRISIVLLVILHLLFLASCNHQKKTTDISSLPSYPNSSVSLPSDLPDIYDICPHQNTKRIEDKAATCIEDGYTGRLQCKDCNAILDWTGEVLPMKGHNYNGHVCKYCDKREPSILNEGDFEGCDVHWTLYDDGELSVTGQGVIPDFPEKENSYFYLYNKFVKTIVVHNGITEIGDRVFRGLKDATTISLSSSVRRIGDTSFEGWSLSKLSLPMRLLEIGEDNFTYNQIFFLELPGTLKKVGKGSFSSTQMVTMRVPASIAVFEVNEGQFSNVNSVAFMGSEKMVSHLGLYKDLTESGECAMVNLKFEYTSAANKLPYCSKRGQTSGDFTYMVFTDDTARVTKYNGNDEEIVIPEKFGKYTVTGIEHNAFEENSVVKKVTLPKTLTDIYAEAFLKSKLEMLVVMSDTLRVGKSAFEDCKSLKTLVFDGVFTEIGAAAFANTDIENIQLASGTTVIRSSAFAYSAIKTFDFSGIEIIGDSAFGQSDLEGALDLSDVKLIGRAAFYNCNLNQITLGNVNSIGKAAFYGNNLTKDSVLGFENAKNVHDEAFPFKFS